LLVPLGFAMGMPFPTGLRALANKPASKFPAPPENESSGNLVEWAWAMNRPRAFSARSWPSSSPSSFGLNATLASGAAAYLLALALVTTLRPVSKVA